MGPQKWLCEMYSNLFMGKHDGKGIQSHGSDL
jgi:hypothetical protein